MQAMQVDPYPSVSYLFSPRGDLYSIDNRCIWKEASRPHRVRVRELEHSKLLAFGVQSMIESPERICPEMLVVLNVEGRIENYWFVRISASEDGDYPGFGPEFVWQLPADWCNNIIDRMSREPANGLSIELTSFMFPSDTPFDPEEHSGVCIKNPYLASINSRAFFMFTRPDSVHPLETRRSLSCARPPDVSGKPTFDITKLDDDTALMIVETCVRSLLRGPKRPACNDLLAMRGVCTLFRDTVDAATEIYTKDIFAMIRSSLTSACSTKMQHARNRISDLECNLFDKVLHYSNINNLTFYSLFMDNQRKCAYLEEEGVRKMRRLTV